MDNTCELSPTNTEPDSLELINALRGHSILHEYSPDHGHHLPEKSSSTTTSSQITSSDRYVSYAIHQMGDSSQDRLPSFPIAADVPVYKYIHGNSPPNPLTSSLQKKEDDSTEFDASDNFNCHTDEILLQKLQLAAMKKQRNLDASSTDDDVDDELEQHDLTNLDEILDKLDQPMRIVNIDEEPYHRYELATTPSSNGSSSSSSKRPMDDIYYIPGYSGLWRPSEGLNDENIPIDYDADDERRTTPKIRVSFERCVGKISHSIFLHVSRRTYEAPILDNKIRPLYNKQGQRLSLEFNSWMKLYLIHRSRTVIEHVHRHLSNPLKQLPKNLIVPVPMTIFSSFINVNVVFHCQS